MPKIQDDLLLEMERFNQARRLIELGARATMIEKETGLNHSKVVRLISRITGIPASKGQIASDIGCFFTKAYYNEASLYLNVANKLQANNPNISRVDLLIKSFEVYYSMVQSSGKTPVMNITRTWVLLKYTETGILDFRKCSFCRMPMLFEPPNKQSLSFGSSHRCNNCDPGKFITKSQPARERTTKGQSLPGGAKSKCLAAGYVNAAAAA